MNYTLPIKTYSRVLPAAVTQAPATSTLCAQGQNEPPTAPDRAPGLQLVYVVENDRISSVITELIVQKNLLGGDVRCFGNGQVAFEALAAAPRTGQAAPDLILLDLDMPLMDGWEFLDALAGLTPAPCPCVFVLTSSINPTDLAKATAYPHVKGFFTKPLDAAGVARMQMLLRGITAAA